MVIPVVGDHEPLETLLDDLRGGTFAEIIVCCGDASNYDFLRSKSVTFIRSRRGRGRQIAKAISLASADWLWILHADVRVSRNALNALRASLAFNRWGAFKVALTSTNNMLRIVGFFMNCRSRLTSVYTGDQGMFMRLDMLKRVGGFPDIDLMEDIECSRRLRTESRGVQLAAKLTVSARKWEREGTLSTVLRMWLYRVQYFFGASPARLANRYYLVRNERA